MVEWRRRRKEYKERRNREKEIGGEGRGFRGGGLWWISPPFCLSFHLFFQTQHPKKQKRP